MKRTGLAALILLGGLAAGVLRAADAPHGTAQSIACGQCHIPHGTLGDLLVNSNGGLVSTLCLSCHTPGGWAGMTRVLSSSQAAVPGVSGTSHAWDVKAISAARGALMPQSATLLDHLAADTTITCSTCHNPHENATPPFLRLDNSADALCLDCHRSRNMATSRTYTGSTLSHPVGIALPSGTGWHNPPLDTNGNPQPSDGNVTNDFVLGAGGVVRCTSCHGVHYTDSNSGTVDGP